MAGPVPGEHPQLLEHFPGSSGLSPAVPHPPGAGYSRAGHRVPMKFHESREEDKHHPPCPTVTRPDKILELPKDFAKGLMGNCGCWGQKTLLPKALDDVMSPGCLAHGK
ncbi:hypothetical protein HGM15179_012257 [Zosterops borbonicus]|uniref:Uncharacterized protein n=1 Tax=Zosterops borbonicus TaxID=364589 RepID=A0A8K1GBA1_9PASS|nr:hypothetical protein HGM15179_012257 [Zosterops borbonicus]